MQRSAATRMRGRKLKNIRTARNCFAFPYITASKHLYFLTLYFGNFFYAAACYPTESFWFRLNYILHVPIPPNRFSVCVRTGKVAPQNSQQTQMSWSDHVSADHRGHKYSLNGITSVKTNETSNAFAYILRQQFSFMCNTI